MARIREGEGGRNRQTDRWTGRDKVTERKRHEQIEREGSGREKQADRQMDRQR